MTIRASSGGWPNYQLSGFAMAFHFKFSKWPVFRWVCAKSADTSHNTPWRQLAHWNVLVSQTKWMDIRVLRCIWLKALFETNPCCMFVAWTFMSKQDCARLDLWTPSNDHCRSDCDANHWEHIVGIETALVLCCELNAIRTHSTAKAGCYIYGSLSIFVAIPPRTVQSQHPEATTHQTSLQSDWTAWSWSTDLDIGTHLLTAGVTRI